MCVLAAKRTCAETDDSERWVRRGQLFEGFPLRSVNKRKLQHEIDTHRLFLLTTHFSRRAEHGTNVVRGLVIKEKTRRWHLRLLSCCAQMSRNLKKTGWRR
jgi:hypothetical protein